jgi:hypothetical protein
MKQHEREFFISTIRSGNIIVRKDTITIVIRPLTIDQSVESCYIYNEAYNQAYIDGMMNENEMEEWMMENGLWSHDDSATIEVLKKDLEKLKIEIYNARNNTQIREKIRLYLRKCEKEISKYLMKKNTYYQNTREGFAASEKASWVIKNTSYRDNCLYDFHELSLQYIIDEWQSSILSDAQIRDLARNEPWRSLWVIKDNTKIKLFTNLENTELTFNQKNLIIWSQMYDNIQESVECPPKDVIEDDDMLDGWFIAQSKKREQERLATELEQNSKNEKIKNASEVYILAQDSKDAERIESMNSAHSANIKKQRQSMIKNKGTVNQHDFVDERLKLQMQQTNQMRGKLKGG